MGNPKYGKHRRNQWKNKDSNKSANVKKTGLTDYMFSLGSARHGSEYDEVSKYLINDIQKKYERYSADIAEALRQLRDVDFAALRPVAMRSEATDEEERRLKNAEFEYEHKGELDEFLKRKRSYKHIRDKAYAFLWGQCKKSLQDKIE